MAYFDSPKNRAMWERRLADLRVEKERRKEEGYMPQEQTKQEQVMNDSNPFRRRITYAQLEEQERIAMESRRVKRPVRAARREMDGVRREKSEPVKESMGMAR